VERVRGSTAVTRYVYLVISSTGNEWCVKLLKLECEEFWGVHFYRNGLIQPL
jgi:hypothetical protein